MLSSLIVAAQLERAPWRCSAPDLPSLPEATFTIDTTRWRMGGHVLHLDGNPEPVVIGIVADATSSAPETLAAIGRIRARLAKEHVALVISLGGLGTTRAELEASLTALATPASFAVVALPGDLEAMPAFVEALANLRARGVNVADGRLVTAIELPNAIVATIPGAGASERLVAGADGCMWTPADVTRRFHDITDDRRLRLVVSSEAPRARFAGVPTGELSLIPPHGSVDVIVHGASSVASQARNGHRDGEAISLSPGRLDATPDDAGLRTVSAGVLVIDGAGWSWHPVIDRAGT